MRAQSTQANIRRELRSTLLAQVRELHTLELASMITLRMSARIIVAGRTEEGTSQRAAVAAGYMSACAEHALHRYAALSHLLDRIDVQPQWEHRTLHGLADRIGESLEKVVAIDVLAQRVLLDTMTVLYRYEELAQEAFDLLDEELGCRLKHLGESCDAQVRACAQLMDILADAPAPKKRGPKRPSLPDAA